MLMRLGAVALLLWLPAPGRAASTKQAFRLGVVNERADQPDFALRMYRPLHQALDAALGPRGVALAPLVIAQSIDEMSERIRAGEVDAVPEGVFPTLALSGRAQHLEPAMLVWRRGQREYHAVFFTRIDSPIETLADLRGRVIAFEAPRSSSAFHLPRNALRQAGLRVIPVEAPEQRGAVRYVFAGSELNQAYLVERGEADAAAFNEGDWQRLPDVLRARLRIFHRTPPILRWLFSFRRGVSPTLREAVMSALEELSGYEVGRAALAQAGEIARFERLNAADLAALRRIAAAEQGH